MNDLLTTDHRELDDLLDQLYRTFEVGSALDIYEKLDIFWARLAMHIRAEHLHLFPATLKALELNKPSEVEAGKSVIARLHSDHDFFIRELAAAIKLMREQIRDNKNAQEKISMVREKVSAVCELLKTHNELEESQVYLWAEELLDPAEHPDLNELIQKELDNLPPRFDGDRCGSQKRIYD
jgi:hemerythrin-like domain-containing protein